MLSKAFRAELVPTDAELARQDDRTYEPASALLERIRLERPANNLAAPRSRRKPTAPLPSARIAEETAGDAATRTQHAAASRRGGNSRPVGLNTSVTAPSNGKRRDRKPAATSTPPIDQTDRNEVLAVIRHVFSDGARRDRTTAIRDVAHTLGYRRTGARIEDVLKTDLLTAVRRGILENECGELRLLCRSADDYSLDRRVEMLIAAMDSGWQTRDEAITAAARHLGFRRTGAATRAAFKSAINAALRRGRLCAGTRNRIRRT